MPHSLKIKYHQNTAYHQNRKEYTDLQEILQKRGLLTKDSIFKNVIENQNIRQIGKILLAAAFITGGIAIAITAPNLLASLGKIHRSFAKDRRKSLGKAFYNLQNNKLIEKSQRANQVFFSITPKGQSVFIKRYIKDIKINRQPKWDHIWRVVLFDIPTSKNNERDILRDRLKYMGFFQFQKSAFITPFPCQAELETILECYGLSNYVTYLEAQKISGAEKCRQYFHI